MSATIRVLIADDHLSARAGVRAILEEEEDFVVCAEAGDAQSAIDAAVAERPDICLLDVNMPGSGIHAAAKICERLPDTVVVMLTVSGQDSDLFDSLRAGAVGYLLKDTDAETFPADLRGAVGGKSPLSPALVGRLIEGFQGTSRRRVSLQNQKTKSLTSREWQILELLKDEVATRDIAERLFVSPITVRRHIGEILKKLGVQDRASAVRLLSEA